MQVNGTICIVAESVERTTWVGISVAPTVGRTTWVGMPTVPTQHPVPCYVYVVEFKEN